MDANGTADISPSARFGVTEAIVTNRLFEGLKKLYEIELAQKPEKADFSALAPGKIVFINDARKCFLDASGKVDWGKVE